MDVFRLFSAIGGDDEFGIGPAPGADGAAIVVDTDIGTASPLAVVVAGLASCTTVAPTDANRAAVANASCNVSVSSD